MVREVEWGKKMGQKVDSGFEVRRMCGYGHRAESRLWSVGFLCSEEVGGFSERW